MSVPVPPQRAQAAPRTARELFERSRDFLARKGASEARLDAEWLVAHALGLDRLGLYLALDRPLVEVEIDRARDLVKRRGRGEPVAYLTGSREFYGRRFAVGPGCLVPRPETELLVDVAREWRTEPGSPAEPIGLDVGTGSGCVALTLALEIDGATIEAIDVSSEALAFAERNAEALGARVRLRRADAFEDLAQRPDRSLDLLVSNPPYVDPRERAALPADVREHEPAVALFAPESDLDRWPRFLLERSMHLLRPGGLLLVELGLGQAERVQALARERGLEVQLRRDLAGIDRVLAFRQARACT